MVRHFMYLQYAMVMVNINNAGVMLDSGLGLGLSYHTVVTCSTGSCAGSCC